MKSKLSVLAALCALFVLIFASDRAIASAAYGLRLCWELILPSLFPFFVVSALLSRLDFPQLAGDRLSPLAARLFHVSGAGATALFIGLTGGYPLGAAYLAELEEQGQLSPRETERLLGFCNNSGPAFLVGAIGAGVFHSTRIGLLLYAAHAMAAILTGVLLRGQAEASEPAPTYAATAPLPFSRALPEAVRAAVLAALNVCGFVVCFTVLTGLLDAWGVLDGLSSRLSALTGLGLPQARALLTGFWELGGGIGAMQGLAASPGNLALAAVLVGWGGVSVHFQTLSALAESKAKVSPHLTGRLMSAALGGALAYGMALLFL
jgi:sporulation integral membrane protein YlbJ